MSRSPDDRRIEVAVITGVHGLQGEIRLKVHSGDAATLRQYRALWLEPLGREIRLSGVKADARGVRARIDGFPDRTAVEPLRGQKLLVDRAALPAPAEDEIYLADLIGLAVLTPDGARVGQVIATANYGAGDLIDIERPDRQHAARPLPAGCGAGGGPDRRAARDGPGVPRMSWCATVLALSRTCFRVRWGSAWPDVG